MQLKQSISNLFERPDTGERAILVHIDLGGSKHPEEIIEFQELARSAGASVAAMITGSRTVPDAKYFIGSGKASEVQQHVQATGARLVIFNHDLSPSQERNLEKLVQARVVDRTGLILDIFAQRARTFEGKLQVELAQLHHLATRLVRGWTHLERQKGGIGLRGPGETQLEVDRRLVKNRIRSIQQRLDKVQSQRAQNRRARQRAELPTVALVGYTNAGKSTLFNRLTNSEIFTADLPFATLDPTLRRVKLPEIGTVILADTVGFIRHLPHDLVAAFKATLEETRQADLLLHIIDVHHEHRQAYVEAVEAVLTEIGADHIPRLDIYNKVDLLVDSTPRIDHNQHGRPQRVWLSAAKGEGIELLQQALVELLRHEMVSCMLQLAPHEGKLRSLLYEMQVVVQERDLAEGGFELELRMPKKDYNALFKNNR